MRTICEEVYSEIGDKYCSRTFNNLAVLVSYSKLQLIQNFLTNGLVPPTTRSPTILEDNSLSDMVGRAAACQCKKKIKDLKQRRVRGETRPQMSHR
jgi:hypothetical protein